MKSLTGTLLFTIAIVCCHAQTVKTTAYNTKYAKTESATIQHYSGELTSSIAEPKVDHKNNATLVVCKSVDVNGNAFGQTSNFKVGESINFLYEAKDSMNYTTMLWNVVLVNDDGTEEYVTRFEQSTGNKPFRFLASKKEGSVFNIPGKYRVYLFEKGSWDNLHGTDSQFVGKADFTVE